MRIKTLKHVKTKILTVFLFSTLILLVIVKANASVSSRTFTSIFPSDSSLAFQHENRFVTLNVMSGTLNSSLCTLQFDNGGGQYTFKANETTTLQIDYNVSNVQVAGDQNNDNRVIESGDTITIDTDNNVVISWNILVEPWLPLMFIIGMIGLVASFGGPLYAINKIKHHEYHDGLRMGIILTVTGIAFVLAWLW